MPDTRKPKVPPVKLPTDTNKYGESLLIGVRSDGTLNLVDNEDDFPEEYTDIALAKEIAKLQGRDKGKEKPDADETS